MGDEKRKRAYDHSDEIAGGSSGDDPSTEHHDKAHGADEPHNEIEPRGRTEPDGYGPRTQDATRVTRKDGD